MKEIYAHKLQNIYSSYNKSNINDLSNANIIYNANYNQTKCKQNFKGKIIERNTKKNVENKDKMHDLTDIICIDNITLKNNIVCQNQKQETSAGNLSSKKKFTYEDGHNNNVNKAILNTPINSSIKPLSTATIVADIDNESIMFGTQQNLEIIHFVAEIGAMFDDSQISDFKFILKNDQIIFTHKFILAARCPLFFKKISLTNIYEMKNFNPSSVRSILRYFYTSELPSLCSINEDMLHVVQEFEIFDLYKYLMNLKILQDILNESSIYNITSSRDDKGQCLNISLNMNEYNDKSIKKHGLVKEIDSNNTFLNEYNNFNNENRDLNEEVNVAIHNIYDVSIDTEDCINHFDITDKQKSKLFEFNDTQHLKTQDKTSNQYKVTDSDNYIDDNYLIISRNDELLSENKCSVSDVILDCNNLSIDEKLKNVSEIQFEEHFLMNKNIQPFALFNNAEQANYNDIESNSLNQKLNRYNRNDCKIQSIRDNGSNINIGIESDNFINKDIENNDMFCHSPDLFIHSPDESICNSPIDNLTDKINNKIENNISTDDWKTNFNKSTYFPFKKLLDSNLENTASDNELDIIKSNELNKYEINLENIYKNDGDQNNSNCVNNKYILDSNVFSNCDKEVNKDNFFIGYKYSANLNCEDYHLENNYSSINDNLNKPVEDKFINDLTKNTLNEDINFFNNKNTCNLEVEKHLKNNDPINEQLFIEYDSVNNILDDSKLNLKNKVISYNEIDMNTLNTNIRSHDGDELDTDLPLLERIKFKKIMKSNLLLTNEITNCKTKNFDTNCSITALSIADLCNREILLPNDSKTLNDQLYIQNFNKNNINLNFDTVSSNHTLDNLGKFNPLVKIIHNNEAIIDNICKFNNSNMDNVDGNSRSKDSWSKDFSIHDKSAMESVPSPPTDFETDTSVSDTPVRKKQKISDSPKKLLPKYNSMNTPHLKKECHRYGIKVLPKKKMVKVLEDIYYRLNPDIEKPVDIPLKNIKIKALKKTKSLPASTNPHFFTNKFTHKNNSKRADQDFPVKEDIFALNNKLLGIKIIENKLNFDSKLTETKNSNIQLFNLQFDNQLTKRKNVIHDDFPIDGLKMNSISQDDFCLKKRDFVKDALKPLNEIEEVLSKSSDEDQQKDVCDNDYDDQLIYESLSDDSSLEDLKITSDKTSLTKEQKEKAMIDFLFNFFKCDSSRHLKLLQYEPFELDDLIKDLRSAELQNSLQNDFNLYSSISHSQELIKKQELPILAKNSSNPNYISNDFDSIKQNVNNSLKRSNSLMMLPPFSGRLPLKDNFSQSCTQNKCKYKIGKISKKFLLDFLDKQNILFTTRKAITRKNRRAANLKKNTKNKI